MTDRKNEAPRPRYTGWEKRARRENDGAREEGGAPRAEKPPVYRDGSAVNECWDRKNT